MNSSSLLKDISRSGIRPYDRKPHVYRSRDVITRDSTVSIVYWRPAMVMHDQLGCVLNLKRGF